MSRRERFPCDRVARLPGPGDNSAIALERLDAGTVVATDHGELVVDSTILEGHRFAVVPLEPGDRLLSWGMPFGTVTRFIPAGGYVVNGETLKALARRQVDAQLPRSANFEDLLHPYVLNAADFDVAGRRSPAHEADSSRGETRGCAAEGDRTAKRVSATAGNELDAGASSGRPTTFLGYRRPGSRGVGTRNCIVLIGTSSRTAGFVRRLETRLQQAIPRSISRGTSKAPNARGREGAAGTADHSNLDRGTLDGRTLDGGTVDGIVTVAHTEGDDPGAHNLALLHRTLAGFIVHPNVAAALVVDYGDEACNHETLREFMTTEGYPLADVPHRFLSLRGRLDVALDEAEAIVRDLFPAATAIERTEEPIRELKIALQCGGSDAFSGISGNPVASCAARDVVRAGGAALLAETDELVGAEPYVLRNVRDLAVAEQFLAVVERFKEWAGWHGVTVEGNPSDGNRIRGLYNVALKSLGAALKKHPDVVLERVLDYAQPMASSGFQFMDSPGNDLESVAGQVASGCNLVIFITGNGSITNFSFVPTVKVVTTSARYELLDGDMDFNAGALLDTPQVDLDDIDELGAMLFRSLVDVASGTATRGESAGHTQVQVWRDWRRTGAAEAADPPPMTAALPPLALSIDPPVIATPAAVPMMISTLPSTAPVTPATSKLEARAYRSGEATAFERIGLILPTSLCAGEIARMAAEELDSRVPADAAVSRFVALQHTEGCGASSSRADLYLRTLVGHLRHPSVACALLLEHGCETSHNGFMRQHLATAGLDPDDYGWASVQLDGGIERVVARICRWFDERTAIATASPTPTEPVALAALRVGLAAIEEPDRHTGRVFAQLARAVAGAGGTVVAAGPGLLSCPAFRAELESDAPATARTDLSGSLAPTLPFAEIAMDAGLHVMEPLSRQWLENLTALGATGVHIVVAATNGTPLPGHPFVPTLIVAADAASGEDSTGVHHDHRVDGVASDFDRIGAPDAADLLALIDATLDGRHQPEAAVRGHHGFQISRGLTGISL